MASIKELQSIFFRVVLTSLCAPLTVAAISIFLHTKISFDFLLLSFLVPASVYFLDYIHDYGHVSTYARLFAIIIVGISLMIVTSFGNVLSLIFLILIFIFGYLYSSVFKKLTRKVVGFKDIFVSLIWNLIILLYFFYYSINVTPGLMTLLLIILIRDIINISFCDMKDIEQDTRVGLRTFAVVFGKDGLYKFIQIMGSATVLILVLAIVTKILPIALISLVVIFLIYFFIIRNAFKRKMFNELIMNAEYYLWFITAIIMKKYL